MIKYITLTVETHSGRVMSHKFSAFMFERYKGKNLLNDVLDYLTKEVEKFGKEKICSSSTTAE